MQMDVGLDTGDILKVVKTEIGVNETSGELLTVFLLWAESLFLTHFLLLKGRNHSD